MEIAFAPEFEQFIREQIQSGRYASATEVIFISATGVICGFSPTPANGSEREAWGCGAGNRRLAHWR